MKMDNKCDCVIFFPQEQDKNICKSCGGHKK